VKSLLLDLEEQGRQALLSGGAARFYKKRLTEDALMVVPGMIVDRATFLAALGDEPAWASFEICEPRVVELTSNCAVVLYRAVGKRPGQPTYTAWMSNTYVRKGSSWLLAYHQQTPFPAS
jgi:hypothetical protein